MNRIGIVSFAAALVACSSDGPGSADKGTTQVFIVPEESITDGLEPGAGDEQIQDGWAVTYDKFLITVGNFRAKSSATGAEVRDPTVFILDLKNAPTGGYVTATFSSIDAIRFDKVGEDMPAATAAAVALAPTTASDAKIMIDGGYSVYVEGRLTSETGRSCRPTAKTDCVDAKEIRFKWGFAMGTAFDDCAAAQGDTGFVVPKGGTVQVKPTIHGDHWFFSDITEGAEVTTRYAQFIADADLDRNGETTIDELKGVRAADAFPTDKYKLSGGLEAIQSAWDYVRVQARTLHDFQGDGECPTRTILK